MKGEYGCNTLHPPHIIMEAKSYVLNAMKMTVMGSEAILPQALSKRVECMFQQKTLPSPSEKKRTHTHTHRELPEAKPLKTPHLPVKRQMTKLTDIYFIELKMNFGHKQFKSKKHTCLYLKCATINRLFSLTKQQYKISD